MGAVEGLDQRVECIDGTLTDAKARHDLSEAVIAEIMRLSAEAVEEGPEGEDELVLDVEVGLASRADEQGQIFEAVDGHRH